jgi:holo-[acyl-carrier protein] synthase
MIKGIGCDIVDLRTTKILKWESDVKIRERVFTPKELEIFEIKCKISFLMGRFAVKEAVLKCFKCGMKDGMSLRDIEVLKLEDGEPFINLFGKTKEISDEIGINNWHVSISHSPDYTIAFVTAESKL